MLWAIKRELIIQMFIPLYSLCTWCIIKHSILEDNRHRGAVWYGSISHYVSLQLNYIVQMEVANKIAKISIDAFKHEHWL